MTDVRRTSITRAALRARRAVLELERTPNLPRAGLIARLEALGYRRGAALYAVDYGLAAGAIIEGLDGTLRAARTAP